MKSEIIAVPSSLPGGVDAEVSPHFGHCDLYTLVHTDGQQVKNVTTLAAIPHEQGGCLGAVNHLVENRVTALIAGGMGRRPLSGFNEAGIRVFLDAECKSVGEAVKAYLAKSIPEFTMNDTCQGSAQGAHAHH